MAENEFTIVGHRTSIRSTIKAYDGADLRVKKSNSASGTLYWRGTNGAVLAETDLSGNITNEYVFFAGRRVARHDAIGNVFYYFADARLGTTIGATDASGNPCYEATYTPYGQETALLNTCPQNYKFAGYERDAETGLDYAFARYYNQRIGRFMSVDPMAGEIHDPQTLNRYAYVRNNPANLTDPSGLAGNCTNNPDYYCGYYALNSNSLGHRPGMNCILDGAEESCDRVFNLIEKGSAAICPNDNCTNLLYTSEGWKKFSAEVFIKAVNHCTGGLDNCRLVSFKVSSRWVLKNAGPVDSFSGSIFGRMLDPKQCPDCNVGRTLSSASDFVTAGAIYTGAGIGTVLAAPAAPAVAEAYDAVGDFALEIEAESPDSAKTITDVVRNALSPTSATPPATLAGYAERLIIMYRMIPPF